MDNSQEHFAKMSTEQLQKLLYDDSEGQLELPFDTILQICAILAERNPPQTSAEEAFRRFKEHYLPRE